MITQILCVCVGNNDRSPAMEIVLDHFLMCAGHKVMIDSAGIGESAKNGGQISSFAITAAQRIGVIGIKSFKKQRRRHISSVNLADYDLIVCANDEIAAKVIEAGADIHQVYNAQITNPWPCQFQEDYDATFMQILSAMYKVVVRYFPISEDA